MISATSNTRPPASEVLHQLIERVHHGRSCFGGQVRVDLSCPRTAMPEVFLNDAEVHAYFQQMCCVRMSKTVNMGAFGDSCGGNSAFESFLQAAIGQRTDRPGFDTAAGCGKQPRQRAVCCPEFPQQFQCSVRQWHIPVLAALSMNVEKHPARIDVSYLKMGAFPQTQATAVDGFQTGAIDGTVDLLQNPVHFLPAQDDGQLLLRTWSDKPQSGPVALQVGPDVFRQQLWFPAGPVDSSGGGASAAIHRR